MCPLCRHAVVGALLLAVPITASAQDRAWRVDIGVGQARLVDDSTKRYLVLSGSARRLLTPRVSIGPEILVMESSDLLTDRIVMVTGNVTFDIRADDRARSRRLVPFIVSGLGLFIGRDVVRNGTFWHRDPAFTAGGGVRARITDALSLGADYRVGWELHQRIGGVCTVAW
jgi:hypothetical protein